MSTVVQPCARCGARWAVRGNPMHWCPRCRGVLLSPAPVDAPPERRNYRWVARPPGRRPRDGRSARPAARPGRATPRYTEIPRWGLRDVPPAATVAGRRDPLAWLTERITGLLILTSVLFAVAAIAELGRYLVLLRNRTRLIHPAVLLISDISVYLTSALALAAALATAIAAVGWLRRSRVAAYAGAGQRDPRSLPMLLCGCLIPGVNLLWPGVFLTELITRRGGDLRALRAVRIWWCAWILNGAMVVAALGWHTAGSLQAEADGVIFTVYTDLVAAAVAALSLWVVRLCEGRDLRGRVREPKRWVPAVGPIVQVIEPVEPADESAERASESAVGNDVGTDAESAKDAASEHEEVMAK
ncbi:DUF4328 domain-containing protein [Nocardia transvalensis]|uniref:DUF4328 domain-containing protein n=1 Tax=Nocardia transvalensis TaxID=37333 RepID=UPI00189617E9|nr:DUF4328 domain-containing protein [Nocardia transvalensis]MBF6328638.1 DUF4328 domain-containing protein [Nocardia transvalensis]